MESLQSLSGEISEPEEAMLRCFGISGFSPYLQSQTLLLGKNINSESFQIWLKQESKVQENIFIFVFLDKILSPWWIKLAKGNIINAHSAVLPYARGMFAIENMAYQGDFEKFQQAAGASIHYIDEGIDTGRIIKAIRFKNPFAFESLSEVKAYSYKLAFDLLIQQAWEILENTQTQSVGIKADPALLGTAFSRNNYTPDVHFGIKSNTTSFRVFIIGSHTTNIANQICSIFKPWNICRYCSCRLVLLRKSKNISFSNY